jgi:anti-sigma-K factor RskA
MNYDHPGLRDRLASEYVLGTLAGGARRRFETLLRQDRALQDAVSFWQRELTPMAAPLRVSAPSARVWEGIAARVQPAAVAKKAPGWFERWFGLRALGTLVAGLVIGVGLAPLLQPPAVPPDAPAEPPPSYAGILSGADGRPALLVNSLRHGRIVQVKLLRPIPIEPTQELRLWALPANGAPIALGSVPAEGKARLDLPATSEQLLSQVTELAVSVEARGAALSAPSGGFLLRGPCAKFW